MEGERRRKRDRGRRMEGEGQRKKDGGRETEEEGWRERDGGRGTEGEGQREKDGERGMERGMDREGQRERNIVNVWLFLTLIYTCIALNQHTPVSMVSPNKTISMKCHQYPTCDQIIQALSPSVLSTVHFVQEGAEPGLSLICTCIYMHNTNESISSLKSDSTHQA